VVPAPAGAALEVRAEIRTGTSAVLRDNWATLGEKLDATAGDADADDEALLQVERLLLMYGAGHLLLKAYEPKHTLLFRATQMLGENV